MSSASVVSSEMKKLEHNQPSRIIACKVAYRLLLHALLIYSAFAAVGASIASCILYMPAQRRPNQRSLGGHSLWGVVRVA